MIRTMRRRDPRQMEEEEEMWFQEDDDFSDMNNKDLASTLGEFELIFEFIPNHPVNFCFPRSFRLLRRSGPQSEIISQLVPTDGLGHVRCLGRSRSPHSTLAATATTAAAAPTSTTTTIAAFKRCHNKRAQLGRRTGDSHGGHGDSNDNAGRSR